MRRLDFSGSLKARAANTDNLSSCTHLPRIYFLHIPKSSGTSFRAWLKDLFAVDRRLPADHLAELESIASPRLPDRPFYSGHFGWRLMELAEQAALPVTPITVLREPVELYGSGWTFTSGIADEDAQKLGPNRQRDIAAVVEQAKTRKKATRKAASAPAETAAPAASPPPPLAERPQATGGEFEYAAFRNMIVRNLAHYGTEVETPIDVGREHFELALQRLRAMPFFGLSADWARSAVLFADAFRLPLRMMDRTKNTQEAVARESLPAGFLNDARAFNDLDFALYDQAVQLFDERYAAMARKFGLPLNAPAEAFREALKQQSIKAGNEIPPAARLRKARVPIAAALLAPGFNHRYVDAKEQCRLWSGPDFYTCVLLPLDRSVPRSVRFNLDSVQKEAILNEMKTFVDGELTPSSVEYEMNRDGKYQIFKTIEVPSREAALQGGYTEIGFLVTEIVPNPDFRSGLSFALTGDIEVAAASNQRMRARLVAALQRLKFW